MGHINIETHNVIQSTLSNVLHLRTRRDCEQESAGGRCGSVPSGSTLKRDCINIESHNLLKSSPSFLCSCVIL